MLGIPLLEKFLGFLVLKFLGFLVFGFSISKFHSFKDSWFLGFLVSKFQSFLVSKFLGFLVSKFLKLQGFKNPECFPKILVPYCQKSIPCFLIDIDRISKIFKIPLDGSSGCFAASLLQHRQTF